MPYYVYLLASRKHGTLYVGVTNDLARRVHEHKEGLHPGFTSPHAVARLVYFEIFDDPVFAITREKQIKKWKRDYKLNVIERDNPSWDDLFEGLF